MTPRNHLPPTRKGLTHTAEIGGKKVYITTGEFEDGTLGEVFIRLDKEGGELRVYDVVAIMISVALQYGVPLKTIVDKLKYQRMEPQGVTNNPEIPTCSSLSDYIGKLLEQKYLPADCGQELDQSEHDSGQSDEPPN